MRARWAVNLALLILVAVLGALAQREIEQERRILTLTGLDPARIDEIGLERPGKPSIRLLRDGSGWRMESPYQVAANAVRIARFTGIAATPVHRSLPETAAAERVGVEPGRVRLTLDGLVLRVGDIEPIDQRRYVAVGGQIHLIDDGFHHHLVAAAEDYVDPLLVPRGFHADAGVLDGEPLDGPALGELTDLRAERIVSLDEEISGRLLTLSDAQGDRSLRFLVSSDGRRWSRMDLRLAYLLADPPFWAIDEHDPPASGLPETQDRIDEGDGFRSIDW